MSEVAIKVEHLGKRYRIGKTIGSSNGRRSLARSAGKPFEYLARSLREPAEDEIIWALRDISFDVKRGDIVGFIGSNGAGKTTLLKILSRITEPTRGRAVIKGSVGSLLEVGSGFHPELTGRENTYLSGAILGMQRSEIARKFDEIVAFAEIEKFIDTPVKRYSSGMYVRLAFAVAAHLDTEILIVDEVLAVGDAAFRRKCLGKMGVVAQEGRTILFVSHNMAVVLSLCDYGYLLADGTITSQGPISSVVDKYIQLSQIPRDPKTPNRSELHGNGRARITLIEINGTRASNISLRTGEPLHLRIGYESERNGQNGIRNFQVSAGVYDLMNVPLYKLDSETAGGFIAPVPSTGIIECNTGPLGLTPGPCFLNVAIHVGGDLADHIAQAVNIQIEAAPVYSGGHMFERREALYLLDQEWQLQAQDD